MSQHSIEKQAYISVLITRCGQTLLRKIISHAGTPRWEIVKGKSEGNEDLQLSARHQLYRQVGYLAKKVDCIAGANGAEIFIMKHLSPQHPLGPNTRSTRWVGFEEAERLISTETDEHYQNHALETLECVRLWFSAADTSSLPAVDEFSYLPADENSWKNLPLPERFTTVHLKLAFDAQQVAMLRMGYVPEEMEEKWFIYFSDNTIFFHHSWTGNCIYHVYLEPYKEGKIATHAHANRDPEFYRGADDKEAADEDVRVIKQWLLYLAEPTNV